MLAAVLPEAPRHQIFVATAAVADWRPAQCAEAKMKKDGSGTRPALAFVENPDILATVARLPEAERPPYLLATAGAVANASSVASASGAPGSMAPRS